VSEQVAIDVKQLGATVGVARCAVWSAAASALQGLGFAVAVAHRLSGQVRAQLVAASPATIDRLLVQTRAARYPGRREVRAGADMDELTGLLPRTGGHRACESGPAENNHIPGAHLRGQLADLNCATRGRTRAEDPYPLVMMAHGAPGHSPRSPHEKALDQRFRWSKGWY
jgi:hypothetical protein